MTDSNQGRAGLDRRTLIKRGAAAGALAWTTPTLLSNSAHAVGVGDGNFTGCVPDVSYVLLQSPQNCEPWNDYVTQNFPGTFPLLSPSCCEESVFGLAIPDNITCGSACEAGPIIPPSNTVAFSEIKSIILTNTDATLKDLRTDNNGCNYDPAIPAAPDGFKFVDAGSCSADGFVTLEIITGVQCEDGACYELQDIVKFNIPNCPTESPGMIEFRTIVPIVCPTPA